MTDEHHWPTVRDHAIRSFNGDLPHPATEQAILDVFEAFPTVVARAVDDVAEQLARGKIRSGWAILQHRVTVDFKPAKDVTVQGDDRGRLIVSAERRIANELAFYEDPSDVLDELFDRGPLKAYAEDETLRERLLGVWRRHRPAAARVERQAEEEAVAWRRRRRELEQQAAKAKAARAEEAEATLQTVINAAKVTS